MGRPYRGLIRRESPDYERSLRFVIYMFPFVLIIKEKQDRKSSSGVSKYERWLLQSIDMGFCPYFLTGDW